MDLSKLRDWINSIPPERMAEVKKLYPRAGKLKYLCLARGWLKPLQGSNNYEIVSLTPEVIELQEVYQKLGVGGIKFFTADGKEYACQNSPDPSSPSKQKKASKKH